MEEIKLKSKGQRMITITKEEYDRLLKREGWLSSLEEAGVENWSGISYAYEIEEEYNKGEECGESKVSK